MRHGDFAKLMTRLGQTFKGGFSIKGNLWLGPLALQIIFIQGITWEVFETPAMLNGLIATRYDYDPYGQRTSILNNLTTTFAYTGHFVHAQSGLYLTQYRVINSQTGRWLSRDPLGELSGEANLYGYVLGNPINLIDQSGLSWLLIVTARHAFSPIVPANHVVTTAVNSETGETYIFSLDANDNTDGSFWSKLAAIWTKGAPTAGSPTYNRSELGSTDLGVVGVFKLSDYQMGLFQDSYLSLQRK